jgi:hypothetical protein
MTTYAPKSAAVLPHPPTLAFEFASTLGNFQHARRQPGGPVFLGIKAREMLADDFARFIPLEAPRAGIPACDDAIMVQHEDGIVCHSLNQEAVASFFTQGGNKPVLYFHSPSALFHAHRPKGA